MISSKLNVNQAIAMFGLVLLCVIEFGQVDKLEPDQHKLKFGKSSLISKVISS